MTEELLPNNTVKSMLHIHGVASACFGEYTLVAHNAARSTSVQFYVLDTSNNSISVESNNRENRNSDSDSATVMSDNQVVTAATILVPLNQSRDEVIPTAEVGESEIMTPFTLAELALVGIVMVALVAMFSFSIYQTTQNVNCGVRSREFTRVPTLSVNSGQTSYGSI